MIRRKGRITSKKLHLSIGVRGLLERNIKSGYYHRLLSTQQPKQLVDIEKQDSFEFIKDPYVAEFMDVPEDLTGKESIIEKALIANLQKFLLELLCKPLHNNSYA